LGGINLAKEGNILLGILAIILGILVLIFPLFSVFTVSILAGLSILFLGIWLLIQSFAVWERNKGVSIAYLILGILGIIVGIGLFGNIVAFSFLVSFWLYLAGFFLIFSAIMSLFAKEGTAGKGSGIVGVILGILYIVLAAYAWNPYYLAILIAVWLIVDGIALFFINPSEIVKMEN
jgi:membrane protein HdeD